MYSPTSLSIETSEPSSERFALPRIAPNHARYIKLGPGGAWEEASLDGGRIDWGNGSDVHELAVAADWTGARADYLAQGVAPSVATSYVRELREFYSLDADTLWITFARGHLWWAFAEPDVVFIGGDGAREGTRFRHTIGPWRNTDIKGRPLAIADLSSKLTQLASYRRTICGVAASDYLLRKINAEEEPSVAAAREARDRLITATAELIRQLHWADFELFVDLIFQRAGWRRVSALGGTMKDIDLLIEQPATGERAGVQVKSSANQRVLDACIGAFEANPAASRFFFVCHSPKGALTVSEIGSRPVHLWDLDALATLAVEQGLTAWLINRAA